MLSAVPKHWFSWDFAIQDATRQAVAEVQLSAWRERGAFKVGGLEYRLYRQGAFGGAFVVEGSGSVVARAQKPSVFRREFVIEHDGRQYTLRARSAWRRACVLFEGNREIGSIVPEVWFSRRAKVDLPDELPLVLRAFVVWLVLLLWKRDSDGGAVSASAT